MERFSLNLIRIRAAALYFVQRKKTTGQKSAQKAYERAFGTLQSVAVACLLAARQPA